MVSNCSYTNLFIIEEGELVINSFVIFRNFINRRPEVGYRFPIAPTKKYIVMQGGKELHDKGKVQKDFFPNFKKKNPDEGMSIARSST